MEKKFMRGILSLIPIGILFRSTYASDTASLAKTYADEYCTSFSTNVTFSDFDNSMLEMHVGTPNYLETVVYDTACTDIWECIKTYRNELITVGLRVGVGIILAVITLLAYIFMSPCACCRCSRCCGTAHMGGKDVRSSLKTFVWFALIIFIVGFIADAVFSIRYIIKLNNGGRASLCETFSTASDVLNGNGGEYIDPTTGLLVNHPFIGTNQTIEYVEQIESVFGSSNTTLEADVEQMLTETEDLPNAVEKFIMALEFVNSELGSGTNMNVSSHQCLLCNACCGGDGSYIDLILNSFNESYAAQVIALRVGIQSQFFGEGLADLNESLQQTDTALTDFSNAFSDNIGTYLIDNKETLDLVVTLSQWVPIGIYAAVIIPLILLINSVIFGVYKSNRSSYNDPNVKMQNPCHASCGWCTWFLYAFIFLLVAGALGILGYAEGSACMMTSDMDQFVSNTYFRLKANDSISALSSNDTIDTIVNECLLSTGSGDLLGGIVVNTGTGKTAGDVMDSTRELVDEFNAVYGNSSTASKTFTTDPQFINLIYAMKTYGNMFMMRADEIRTLLGSTSSPASLIPIGFGGVADCASMENLAINGTVATMVIESMKAAANTTVSNTATNVTLAGAEEYYAGLTTASINIGASSSSCPGGYSTVVAGGANAPWTTLMTYKMGVVNKIDYQCDTVQFDDSGDSVVQSVTAATCTYANFGTYIYSMADMLVAIAAAMDTVVANAASSIDQTVETPLSETVLPALDAISHGLDCKFMNSRLNSLNSGLCWAHAPGVIGLNFALIGLGVLGLIAIAILFAIWRHLKDNKDAWLDATAPGAISISHDNGGPSPRRGSNSNRPAPIISGSQVEMSAAGQGFGPSVGASSTGIGGSMRKKGPSRSGPSGPKPGTSSRRRSASPKMGSSPSSISAVQAQSGPNGNVVVVSPTN